ncbi:hypothetical protein DIZ27_32800 [Streptomyces sp. NWU339]|uniref:hypothetical protein n=1 Tax=Streptomyces sp. NWU339 TaxID=2185284 RepID=UPI000D678B1C|nr:hypothetical protein [Streptomyces sp. NWU339]PWI06522.1 hypothetical protein DIZ27_32800 [Streptomyces sp. NWU339]
MGCGCGSKTRARSSNSRSPRTLHQVVLDGGKGRVAFQSTDKEQARSVARSYPGSIVREDGATTTAASTTTGTDTASSDSTASDVSA